MELVLYQVLRWYCTTRTGVHVPCVEVDLRALYRL
jgi:hypothetical protein